MFHTLIIAGNVGREPEMRYTPSGQAVTSFSVATSRQYTNQQGQKVEETIWFRINTWGKLAETCNQYVHKGMKVLIEGRLIADTNGSPRIWTRQDGTPAASFEVNASTVRFISSKGSAESGPGEEVSAEPASEDEIPF